MTANNKLKESLFKVIGLIGFVFVGSLASDIYIGNNGLLLALGLSFVSSIIILSLAIPKLKQLKVKQIIRKEGPTNHQKKEGTPTMGGLAVVPVGLIAGTLISMGGENLNQLLAISCLTLGFMCIGSIDDWKSMRKNTNTGLTPKAKILLQIIVSFVFLIFAGLQGWISSTILLFGKNSIDVGLLIWPLSIFVLLAESNAANLTDGLDGLASGCGSLIFSGLAIEILLRENTNDHYLASFCIAMAGAWLGFLVLNRYPARVFMGDTGSLAMGAALSGIALISNSLWSLLVMGGIFLAESLSVIIQVWVFKITKKFNGQGKKLFRMAPIHHHYELSGTSELSIVQSFWIVNIGLVLLGLFLRPSV